MEQCHSLQWLERHRERDLSLVLLEDEESSARRLGCAQGSSLLLRG